MIYRILTEDKDRAKIEALVSGMFDGATIFSARGIWQGASENSLVIEIDGDVNLKGKVLSVAKLIKDYNAQEAVLVQVISADKVMV